VPSATRLDQACGILHALLAGLERLVADGTPEAAVRCGWRPVPALDWERRLAAAALETACRDVQARWGLLRLRDPRTGGLSLEGGCGFGRETFDRLRERPFDFELEAFDSRLPLWRSESDPATLDLILREAFPETRALVSVPLINGADAGQGVIALGFDQAAGALWSKRVRALTEPAGKLAAILHAHRRLQGACEDAAARRPQAPQPCPCLCSRNGHGVPSAVSLAYSDAQIGQACCGYCAEAVSAAGDRRLFTATLGIDEFDGAWEALALEAAFDVACLLGVTPGDLPDVFDRAWGEAGGSSGLRPDFRFACADVAESGKEYVFAGALSHLLYESRLQMATELSSRPAEREGPVACEERRIRMGSGDILILHAWNLPDDLTTRHQIHRQLQAALARDGRRPIEVVAARVNAVLGQWSLCPAGSPALLVLRSE